MNTSEMIRSEMTPVISAGWQGDALLPVYKQPSTVIVGGEGSYLVSAEGKRYLDFTAGIAVNALGYGDPDLAGAIRAALDTGLIHTSNLYRTLPVAELASWLVAHSFADRVFFCNSGAEANEGAFKFARRWARENGGADKYEIVAFRHSFHGRTFGALAATDRPGYQEPFRPLMPGVHFVEPGDVEGFDAVVSAERTAAVIIEPIQAEGGVVPVPPEFLAHIREVCDRNGVLLIFDEVQVGLGRTGNLWGHEATGVTPDLMTLAKPIAGGLPMGAVLLTERVAAAIRPGDHATTFGGGPLVASAALAVCRKIGSPDFLADIRRKGDLIADVLGALALQRDEIVSVRGSGLIWGIETSTDAAPAIAAAFEAGLLLVGAGPRVIRLLPPLNISDEDLRAGLTTIAEVL
ncbi:MAG: acetylornithine/succinylornithine family transaminase [Gemmatimonadota bacterium]|jgi:predicted acetylornithine/succinylornithine family transaminase|nr:acetylornithine/succinylornithine family transaminase [Gemmatimonadota bacterium]